MSSRHRRKQFDTEDYKAGESVLSTVGALGSVRGERLKMKP